MPNSTQVRNPAIQACVALMERMRMDSIRMEEWSKTGVPYMEKRYPTTLLAQINCHNVDDEWFGYTFEHNTLKALNYDAACAGHLPSDLKTALNNPFYFGHYVYLLLTTPSSFKYWTAYEDCPGLSEDQVAYKFKVGDYIMGHTGVLKIENCYRELGDVGACMYDPTEKGKILLDVGVDEAQLAHITSDLSRHLTLVCNKSNEEVLIASRLFVGDPVRYSDISLPWSDERCNARSITLTNARKLGFEHVQLSRDGVWQSEIRKDPSI